jgi:hypothetical protein
MRKVLINIKMLQQVASELFDSIHEVDSDELNDIITEDYPFQNSLDEVCLDITKWTEKIISKIDAGIF